MADLKTIAPRSSTNHVGEVLDSLTVGEAKLLEKIELALLEIESKTYGTSTACGREIPMSRLEAKAIHFPLL